MILPERFLADLPAEAAITPEVIVAATQALRRNRARSLRCLNTEQVAAIIVETARNWLRSDYAFRRLASEHGPQLTGFSRATLERGLDAFFREWTPENIHALLVQDLGTLRRLDQFSATEMEQRHGQSALATAPELMVHVTAGNLPVSAMTSLLLGLLVRSAQVVKCASGAAFLPRLLAHSLAETEPGLAASLELVEWPGGSRALDECLLGEADLVTASGTDETLAAIQAVVPRHARFVGYGHRVSFGYIPRDSLGGLSRQETVDRAANDVTDWDQCGCLSPHVFYVEGGGACSAEQFAEALSDALARREQSHPRGRVSLEESVGITLKRDFYAVRATAAMDTQVWQSADSTAWTVVFEGDPQFQLSALNRFVYVKPVADLEEVLRGADGVRGRVSTVGLAEAGHRNAELAEALARWGVTRICPLGRMQQPPLTWRHDGRPALGDLVLWTNWETGG